MGQTMGLDASERVIIRQFQAQTIPAFNTAVTVPANVLLRHVWGACNTFSTLTDLALIQCEVETGVGTGVYDLVQEVAERAGGAGVEHSYGFTVPGGRRYRFQKGGLAGTTETISLYNYVDLK